LGGAAEQQRYEIQIQIVAKERVRDARLSNQSLGLKVSRRRCEQRCCRRLDDTGVNDMTDQSTARGSHDVAMLAHSLLAQGASRYEQQLVDAAQGLLERGRVLVVAGTYLKTSRSEVTYFVRVPHQ